MPPRKRQKRPEAREEETVTEVVKEVKDETKPAEDVANELYDACCLAHGTSKFSQQELVKLLPGMSDEELLLAVNYLLQKSLFKPFLAGRATFFEVVKRSDAEKISTMNGDERMIYEAIAAAGSEGAWTKHLKQRSNLHDTVMKRCLKSLEQNRYIKDVKSVKFPTRKIYMLMELTPSIEVSGGPWFTDSELDLEFVEGLLKVCERFILSKSFPKAPAQLYDADYGHYPNLSNVHEFLREKEISQVALSETNVQNLLDVLVYDGRIELRKNATTYRAIKQGNLEGSLDGFTETPCSTCPVFSLCESKGPVSAATCEYLTTWLEAA